MDPFINSFTNEIFFLFPLIKIINHNDVLVAQLVEVAYKATPDKTQSACNYNHDATGSGVAYASIGGQVQIRLRSP